MYSRIVVPIDTSYADHGWLKEPFENALEFARKSSGTLHLVSIVPENLFKGYYPDLHPSDVVGTSERRLKEVRDSMLPSDVKVQSHVEEGGICSGILNVVRDVNADLIVVASHGPLARDYLLGSNAAHLALHAPCSVFVVRE